jgi:threonine dehydratase
MFFQVPAPPITGKVPFPKDVSTLSRRVGSVLCRTPVLEMDRRSFNGLKHGDGKLYLKLESLQRSGSCKIRAVVSQVLSHPKERWQKGWVVVGGINYIRAAAAYAELLNIGVTLVCVSEDHECLRCVFPSSSRLIHEKEVAAGVAKASALATEQSSLLISQYENSDTMLMGYATMGFEILLQTKNLHAVLVPMVSGALVAGVGAFIKQMTPNCVVYGVISARDVASFNAAEKAYSDGGANFNMMCLKRFVDELLVVSPETIRLAIARSYSDWHLPLQESGALAVAGLMARFGDQRCDENVALVLSGGNISADKLASCVQREFS